jgi:predicted permease
MKRKNLLYLILIVSVIGFATGFYLKFVKSYTDEKLQVRVTNIAGENVESQPKLSETIALLDELESLKDSSKIDSNENNKALKRLKTINIISIIIMVVSIIIAFWTTKKLLTKGK